jgi:hypothetical protein
MLYHISEIYLYDMSGEEGLVTIGVFYLHVLLLYLFANYSLDVLFEIVQNCLPPGALHILRILIFRLK